MVFALLLCLLTGCREPSSTAEDVISFTDALGRRVSVPRNVPRVAALLGSFAEIWVLAGGTLCASTEDAWSDFGLAQGDAVNIGGAHSPGLERLLASDPQFVLASASTAAHVAMKDTLETLDIPVAYFDVDHFEDYLSMLEICTAITGRRDLYEQNGLRVQRQIAQIKSRPAVENLPEERSKILLLRAASDFVKAKGSQGTILGEMLADLGCVNIADRDGSLLENLSIEAVLRENPYRIFVVTMGNDPEKAQKTLEKLMEENPAWRSLDAVKNGRLHVMEKRLFNLKPNVRWAESYEILYELLTEE